MILERGLAAIPNVRAGKVAISEAQHIKRVERVEGAGQRLDCRRITGEVENPGHSERVAAVGVECGGRGEGDEPGRGDRHALRRAEQTASERMGSVTAGLPLPPGFKMPF